MKPLIGITATPVIDRKRRTIYFTVKSGSSGFLGFNRQVSYRLFAIDLMSGDIRKSVDITASFLGPDGAVSTFKPEFQLQRASLLEVNNRIYVGFGSHQDTPPFHGWLLAYGVDDLLPIPAYCTTCGRTDVESRGPLSSMGGIWQGGGGPASDGYGNIYVITGNGTYDQKTGDRAESFIKFDKDLNVLGSWTPVTYDCLSRTDADLGSAGPVFISYTSTLVGGGKEGLLYAIGPDALQGTQVGTGQPLGIKDPCYDVNDPTPDASGPGYWSIQASPQWEYRPFTKVLSAIDPTFLSLGFHHIHGSPVHWNVRDGQVERSLLYVSPERDLLRAYALDDGFVGASAPGHDPVATFHSKCLNAKKGMPGGFLTLSANGNKPESGIIWAAMPKSDEDAFTNIVPGILRAYKAYPDHGVELVELWNSDSGSNVGDACEDTAPADQSEVGLFAKFVPPTVGVDGIITDEVSNLYEIAAEDEMRTSIRLAKRSDNPFESANEAYGLVIHTGDIANAGTDAKVTFTLTGSQGAASVIIDTSLSGGLGGNGRMERNVWDFVTLRSPDLGNLWTITVQRDNSGFAPAWFLDQIAVESFRYNATKQANFNRWIDTTSPFTAALI
jgi:hypothetical protein